MTILAVAGFVTSVALLLSFAIGEALGLAWRMRQRPGKLHPWALAAPMLAVALPAVGITMALFSLLPRTPWQWLHGLCACEALPGQHVCPFHFADSLGLALATTGAAVLFLLPRLKALALTLQRHRDVEHLATLGVAGASDPVLVEGGGHPLVFVAGLRSPRLFVERTWWARLDDREREAISAHEQTHIESRDPWTAAVLDLLLALFAPHARSTILADWMLATEVRADAAAAQRDGDPLYVAEVLCRYARAAAPIGTLGIGGFALEERVRSLLDGEVPASPRWSTAACTAAFFVACGAGHIAHALFEALLRLVA